MGVYIKGMDMPESCSDCFLDYDSIVCMALNKEFPDRSSDDGFYAYCSGRMPDCPLVEVSSEDVQPVKHGRWIKARGSWCTPGGDPVWECSECGKGMHVYGIEHGTYGSDVADGQWVACPNCGAVMDGET